MKKLNFIFAILLLLTFLKLSGQQLDIEGNIKISNETISPQAGMMRWTGSDFEGYNGSEWLSLTNGDSNGSSSNSANIGVPLCIENQVIVPPVTGAGIFGSQIERVGDLLFISNPFGDDNTSAGIIYVYELINGLWTYADIDLQAPDPINFDNFGSFMASNDNYLLVSGFGSGEVHMYEIVNRDYSFISTIETPNSNPPEFSGLFGEGMAIEGDLVAISEPGASVGVADFVGVVYISICWRQLS